MPYVSSHASFEFSPKHATFFDEARPMSPIYGFKVSRCGVGPHGYRQGLDDGFSSYWIRYLVSTTVCISYIVL